MVSIENPVSFTFKLMLTITKLQKEPGWHWLMCSYCKCASLHYDQGNWPKKNTNWLVFSLLPRYQLLVCSLNCPYLVHHDRQYKHKVVICNNLNNWAEQRVLHDPMEKG